MSKSSILLAAVAFFMASQAAHATDTLQETNKKIVVNFYELGFNKKQSQEARKYLGDRYVQHNPRATDGPDGFVKYIETLREKFPQSRSEIKRAIADGDYVVLHVHEITKPDDRGDAVVEIYRLENGKIVEHWDVIQPVPEKSANTNTMF